MMVKYFTGYAEPRWIDVDRIEADGDYSVMLICTNGAMFNAHAVEFKDGLIEAHLSENA